MGHQMQLSHKCGQSSESLGMRRNLVLEPEESKNEEKKRKHWQHITYRELPSWLKDNEFLLTHHRPELRSYLECFRSILGLHTETGNIWSHLLGGIVFIGFTIHFFNLPTSAFKGHEYGQKIAFCLFFIGAILCLSLSATYHTLSCHSKSVNKVFHKLDYVGISLLIVGSYIPWTYYGFYCHNIPRKVYLSIICVLCITTIIVTMAERFATPAYRPIRALLYVCLGCFGFIPFTHFWIISGWDRVLAELRPDYMLTMGGMYIFGAVLYGARIPERFMPGKCDLVGQSHQIFHVLVVMAALLHLKGVYEMADFRFSPDGACKVF